MKPSTLTYGRVHKLFRTLSVLTLVEAALGFLVATYDALMIPLHFQTLASLLGRPYPKSILFLYLIISVTFIFQLLLVAAGILLWKQQRKGLLLIIAVLSVELIYFVAFSLALSSRTEPSLSGLSKAHGYIIGMGLIPFIVQIVTAFPIVAVILIYFIYRYLGIPARQ